MEITPEFVWIANTVPAFSIEYVTGSPSRSMAWMAVTKVPAGAFPGTLAS